MDSDNNDDDCPRKRFQMNTTTPKFSEAKDLPNDTPSSIGSAMEVDESGDTEYTSEIDEAAPDALPMRYLSTKKFNTTSSVYASETIAAPDINQILFCLGSVLQAQMVEDDEASADIKALHPEFDIIPDLKPECGGVMDSVPDHVLESDAPDDDDLRFKLMYNIVPSVDTITRYIGFLSMCIKLTPEVNIIALVYVNRLASNCHLVLTMSNWRSVWLTCIILAQKMWNDRPVKTGSFANYFHPMDKTVLRGLEARALQLLDFSIGVKPSLYVKYYFELRQLFTTIMGFKLSEWRVRPLTVRHAYRLEALCRRTKAKLSPAITDHSAMDNSALEKSISPAIGEDKQNKGSGNRKERKSIASHEDSTYTSQARFVLS